MNFQRNPKLKNQVLFFFNLYLVYALTDSIANNDDLWLVDSGASRCMTGDRDNLTSLRRLSQKIELGDNNNYVVKGVQKTSIELESGESVHLSNILYVPGLKRIWFPFHVWKIREIE